MTPVPMAISESLLDVASDEVEAKTILYLGTLVRVRRLDMLLDAMKIVLAKHSSARLFFVGDGDSPEDRSFLEKRAKELGIGQSVVFTGKLPMDEAHEYVSRSAVCVSPFYPIPILLSTSPTKISEYMALGRPVVANTHPEQSQIIEQGGAGYCVEWSAEEFARAIVKLLDDPAAAEEMGERGRAFVRANRTYGVVAPKVASVYRQLLADRALQPARR
jgi:glycosyltransferase involved in cell wall biosynthesis